MLAIRLFRVGKRNQPSFKIVVTEKTKSSTKGRFVEQVGFYNPQTKEKVLKPERIKYWLGVGAEPSDTIFNLLVSEKIVEGKKKDVHKKSKKPIEETASTKAEATPSPEIKEAEVESQPSEPAEKPAEEKPKEEKPEEEKKPADEIKKE